MKRLLPALLSGWALVLVLQTSPALGQPESDSAKAEASRHFVRGAELFRDGLFRPALVELQRAYEISPNYRVLYNIAQTHVALGEFVEAIDAYEGYLDEGGSEISPERRAELESELPQLRARTATLLLLVSRADAVVRVDDRKVGRSPITVPISVNVGHHRISAQGEDGWAASFEIDVAGGDREEITLELTPPRAGVVAGGAPEPGPLEKEPGLSRRQRLAVGLFAGAGALALGGGGMALAARSAKKDYDKSLAARPGNVTDIRSTRDTLSRRAWTADILWGAALLTGGVGLVYLLREPETETQDAQRATTVRVWARLGPGGIAAEGRF